MLLVCPLSLFLGASELSQLSSAVAEGEADSLCQAGFGTPVYPCTISQRCTSLKTSLVLNIMIADLAEVACYGPGLESVKQEVFNDLGLEDYECVIPDAERTTALDV